MISAFTTQWLDHLQRSRAIAVIRSDQVNQGVAMATAVAAGGIRLIEITWNSDRPAHLIARLRSHLPHCRIGAGTLLTVADVQEAVAAGAQFLFTPHTSPPLIQVAQSMEVPLVAGALSPTEIVTAWQAGAACVKVFPIQAVGGVAYLHALQGPLGHIPLIPTGGVTMANARALIAAGAIAVGLSGDLFPKGAIAQQNWNCVTQRAQQVQAALTPTMPH